MTLKLKTNLRNYQSDYTYYIMNVENTALKREDDLMNSYYNKFKE